jgi:predicted ribosome quality control (RQC) complex YloA/Tae2 family protein
MTTKIWTEIDAYNYSYNCKKTGNMYLITVGKNKHDNWKIIDNSHKNDYWFHLDNLPSSHVIVHIGENDHQLDKAVLKFASWLCKKKSKKKDNEKLSIIYTQIKNITKGLHVGSVTPTFIKQISV